MIGIVFVYMCLLSQAVVSDSLEPTSLLCPWYFPGENNGAGCHFLLHGIFPGKGLTRVFCISCMGRWVLYHCITRGALCICVCVCVCVCVLVAQLYPALCDGMDCSPPGSSVLGILQARMLERLPFPSPKDLPNPRIESRSPEWQKVSSIVGRFFSNWAIRELYTCLVCISLLKTACPRTLQCLIQSSQQFCVLVS